jgi:hypothetical protein
LALGLGCGPGCRKEFQTVYGQRSGPGATESVNGTVVLAEMFEAAGHHVSSWSSLSPRLDQADCVVWFPDDFQPPSPGVENWFERWLRAKPHRSLIYVGRDFDAAPWYWRKIQLMVPADQQEAIAELRAKAERAFQSARPKQPWATGRWFTLRYDAAAGPARGVTGDSEWSQDLDPSQVEIEFNGRMSPRPDMEALLDSEQGLIVGRLEIGESQLLAVANGSFLLNAMLVNHEHRKLAGKLVDAVGRGGRDVVFLESGQIQIDEPIGPRPATNSSPFSAGPAPNAVEQRTGEREPPIRRADPAPRTSNGLELLLVWPTNWVLLHFALIGILFCFWKLPIFGLPRPEERAGAADFGRHIDAVAALLKRTADRRYALSRVKHYQQIVKKVEAKNLELRT